MPQYLNIGCGIHYSRATEWTNLDFSSKDKAVITHNLLEGIPFPDQQFELVYHSHVLEHFSKQDGEKLIRECHRVLKPGGILRIAIPDLETIARLYLKHLELAWENPESMSHDSGYQWMLMEMYDQCVRSESGGTMKQFLQQLADKDADLVRERIGVEYQDIMDSLRQSRQKQQGVQGKIRMLARNILYKLLYHRNRYEKLGRFRLGGEIHQWMYDKYSLRKLLSENGFSQFEIMTAFTSKLPGWSNYELDGSQGKIRKPDSLFVEGVRI